MWPFTSHKACRRSPTYRPRLEALEDRYLLSAPGTLDTTFGSGGIATTSFGTKSNDYGSAVAVQSDGKILEAGISKPGTSNTTNSFDLARYNSNGTLDSTFGTGGEVMTKFPANSIGGSVNKLGLLVQPDGKVLLEGEVNGNIELIRYNPNGTLDTTWGGTGMVNTAFPYSLVTVGGLGLEPVNGVTKIVAAGDLGNYTALARYNLDGGLDTSFGSGGQVVTSLAPDNGADALAIQPDGKIVVAGGTQSGETAYFLVARFDLSGNLDPTFGNGGVATGSVFGSDQVVLVQSDGKIVAGGEAFTSSGGVVGWGLERLNSDGSLDSTFGTGGVVHGPVLSTLGQFSIRALAIQTNGKLVAAGSSPNAGFVLARYNPDGSLDTTFGTGGQVTRAINGGGTAVALVLQADGKIIAAGSAPKSKTNSAPEFALVRYWGDPVPVIGSFSANPNPVVAGSTVTLTASNITDASPGASITQVAFYLDSNGDGRLEPGTDQLLSYATQTSPGVWTFTYTVNLPSGDYTLFTQAQDSLGALSNPDALTLTVQ